MLDMLSDTQHLCQNALELGDAGTAIGAGTQCRAKRGDVAGSRRDGGAYGIAPHPETGANHRPAIGPVGRATG